MLSSNKIKFINSLKSKKNRKRQGFFIAEGDKIVNDLIQSKWEVTELFAKAEWIEKFYDKKIEDGVTIHEIKYNELKKISSLTSPHNVLAIVKIPEFEPSFTLQSDKLYLLLDNIQDPGNLGTIIRTAGWFGIQSIICSPDSVDIYNPKVIQASMNAFVQTKVSYYDLKQVLKQFKQADLPVYGTFMNGENIFDTSLRANGAILFGNESKGISEELTPYVTCHLHIPSFQEHGKSYVESLNIATAVAIVCSEFRKSPN